jgi:hypothetical protein
MVFFTGLYKETPVQMLRIYANYIVGMFTSNVYGIKKYIDPLRLITNKDSSQSVV